MSITRELICMRKIDVALLVKVIIKKNRRAKIRKSVKYKLVIS